MSIVGLSVADDVHASVKKYLNIPSESLGVALNALAKQRGFQIVYVTEELKGLRTRGAKGDFTPEEALKQLLSGTGFTFRYVDDKTVTVLPIASISDQANPPLSTGPSAIPQSNGDAWQQEGKKSASSTFRLAQVDQAAPASPATVEKTNEQAPVNAPGRLDEIIVTGTSIPAAESAASANRPIDVVTSEDIQNAGVANLEDFFHSQPEFVLSGQSGYTNEGGQSNGNGTNVGATTLNLRGLGPQYTLVLLNGRRFEAEDPANIDLIPVDAIERIDVLKSGASAVYGSDAVAGVVNIITKRNVNGFSFDAYYGESGQRDDDTKRLSASWGTSSDNMSFLVVGEYYTRAGLTFGQRSLSADPDLSRFNSGYNYQAFPYSSLAQIILPNGTGPLVLNQSTFTCGGYSRNPADYVPLNSHLYATSCDVKLDWDKQSLMDPEQKGTMFASFDYKFTDDLAIYADLDFARSHVESIGYLYGADGYGNPNSPLNLSPIPASNYWNPFGVPIQGVSYGFPEAGPQINNVNTSAGRLNLGIKGAFGLIHYDVGGSYYYNYANDGKYNYPTNAGLYAAENRPGAEAVNLFCNDCNTAAQVAGIFANTSIQDWEESALFNAHAYAPVFTLPSGDINLAAGAEYQRDAYIVQSAPALANGAFYDVLSPPISADRGYTSVYVEGQLPLAGKAFTLPGVASLGIDVSARYESIQNVGSRTDPTLSVRWEPLANSVALRASYGTSFRAPPLTSAYAPVVLEGAAPLINPATGQYANYDVIAGGNKNLKPETATYTTYGIVLTPEVAPGLTLQLDRWIINQKNIVIQTSPQLVLDGIQPGGTFTGPYNTPGVYSLYMNAAGQQVNGIDLDADYRIRTDSVGLFDFRWNGTYLNSFRVNDATGAGFVQYAGGTALASSLPSITGLPKIRSVFSANWIYGPVSVTYLLHYTGSYVDPTIPGGVEVADYVTHDIQLNYDLGKLMGSGSWLSSLKLTVGVNDLTYAKVPIFYAGPGGGGGGTLANGYDTSIVNPVGRFFYGQFHLNIPHH
jgi:iron complex outermembrane receptor protein